MIILYSQVNGCTYTLDPDHSAVLYYHPLLSDGTCETVFSAYAEVEWDELDDEALTEADRCYKLLKADIEEQEAEQERLMEHEHRHNEPHEYDHDYYYEYRGESSPGGIGYCGAGS